MMLPVSDGLRRVRSAAGALAVGLLLTSAGVRAQDAPEELRGKVTSVSGDRIRIALSQQEWLPRAGVSVQIGQEMAGMFVPLKGSFVIIQVDADCCFAKATGKEEAGTPAAGMLAVLRTVYPTRPQKRSDYVERDPHRGQQMAALLQMAEGGDRMMQNMIAMTCETRGDHDGAIAWWERASNGATERYVISVSATGRSRILCTRNEFEKAVAILKNAASRTTPRADEMAFPAYHATGSGLEWHVRVLKELGHIYRIFLENGEESRRCFQAAAEVMAACAAKDPPAPGTDIANLKYRSLLNDLVGLYTAMLENTDAAIPWLQVLARNGDEYAQKRLTDMGRTW